MITILGVYKDDYEVATIANHVKPTMERHGVTKEGVLQIVFKSATFPTANNVHAHNLHLEFVA